MNTVIWFFNQAVSLLWVVLGITVFFAVLKYGPKGIKTFVMDIGNLVKLATIRLERKIRMEEEKDEESVE